MYIYVNDVYRCADLETFFEMAEPQHIGISPDHQ